MSILTTSEIIYDLVPVDSPGNFSHVRQGSLVRHTYCSLSLGVLIQFMPAPAGGAPLAAQVLWTTPPSFERIRITSTGGLGIGTTCPSTKLRV